jgi:cytochrome c6
VIAGGQTLFPEALARNGLLDEASLNTLIYGGKGKMPGYGADCAPKLQCTFGPRLPDDTIRELAHFVKEQSDARWPSQ